MLFISVAKLSYLQRAQLYTQLAALNRAGIAAAQSWRMLDLGEPWQKPIAQVRRALERGLDVAGAGERAGILLPLDAAVIRATQHYGDLTPAYQRLAKYYQDRALQWQRIRARMLLPAVMLILALLIKPLPGLILGQLSLLGYIFRVIKLPVLLLGLTLVGRALLHGFQTSSSMQRPLAIDQILLALPVFGGMHRRRCLADFWHALAMLSEAGLAMFEAFPIAVSLVNNQVLQADLRPVLGAMQAGQTFYAALVLCPLFSQDRQVRAFINSGENSGSLPEMMARLAAAQDEALALAQQQVSEWLPRLAYAAVAIWMAYGLLAAGPATTMPAL